MFSSGVQPVSSLTARTYADLAHVSRDWWDSLVHPSAYLSYDWLRSRSGTIDGQPRFVGVSGGAGDPVLAFPAYLTDGSSHPGYDPARLLTVDDLPDDDVQVEEGAPAALADLRAALRSGAVGKGLVVAAPGRMGGVSYAANLSPGARRDALTLAAAEVESQAADAGTRTVCWAYFVEGADDVLDQVLLERNYTRVVIGADCYLPLRWNDFDEYLGSFRSRRRWAIRRELAAVDEAGVSIVVHGPDVLDEELAALELQWRQKYGRQATLDQTMRDYRALREHIGGALHVFVARQGGRAVGFTTFIENDGVWWARFPGFDYSTGHQLYLYFNLLFYHPIQAAMARRVKAISYSISSYETKVSRGCSLRHLLAYVRLPDVGLHADLDVVDRAQRRRFARIGHLTSAPRERARGE